MFKIAIKKVNIRRDLGYLVGKEVILLNRGERDFDNYTLHGTVQGFEPQPQRLKVGKRTKVPYRIADDLKNLGFFVDDLRANGSRYPKEEGPGYYNLQDIRKMGELYEVE